MSIETNWALTKNRRLMTHHLFEDLIFLKTNERFWNSILVAEAINGSRGDRTRDRMEVIQRYSDM